MLQKYVAMSKVDISTKQKIVKGSFKNCENGSGFGASNFGKPPLLPGIFYLAG